MLVRLAQPSFEEHERQKFHNISWQPIPMIAHTLWWKYFAITIVAFLLLQAWKFFNSLLLRHCLWLWCNASDQFFTLFLFSQVLVKKFWSLNIITCITSAVGFVKSLNSLHPSCLHPSFCLYVPLATFVVFYDHYNCHIIVESLLSKVHNP